MAIHPGSYYEANFTVQDGDGVVIDITGWTFRAMFRESVDDETPLLELTSENGGFSLLDAPQGRMTMAISAAQTAALPLGHVVFDVLRTDVDPGPIWLFSGKIKVKQVVTRDE